jgi:glycosyltransferase involved in cell wall biosynthesis
LDIGVSESVAEKICKVGFNSAKVTYIQNAVYFQRLETYENINLADQFSQKVVIMFGWNSLIKGVDIAIEAIKQLNSENYNILLAICLAGGNEVLKNEIVIQLGEVPSWIKLLESREDIATYYNASDIFLSASREEGLNYSVIEAAYCKCALIVSEIPGNPQDIPYTLKFKVNNIQELKCSIHELIGKSKAEIEHMKKIQKEYVLRVYDLKKWAKKLIDIYDSFK